MYTSGSVAAPSGNIARGRRGLEVSGDPDVVPITKSVCPPLALAASEPAVRVGGVQQFQMPDLSAAPGPVLVDNGEFYSLDVRIRRRLQAVVFAGGEGRSYGVSATSGSPGCPPV